MNRIIASRRQTLKLLVAGAVLPLTQACGVLPVPQDGGATVFTDGNELSVAVYKALKQSPLTTNLNLEISSPVEAEVIVKGFASDQNEVSSIEHVAGSVNGVRHVLVDVYVR